MLESIRVISRGLVAQLAEHLPRQQRVKVKSTASYSFQFNEMARPGRFELPTLCLEGTQCKTLSAASGRLQENSPFISLLNWTEDGLK
jgi:hypothetical protein